MPLPMSGTGFLNGPWTVLGKNNSCKANHRRGLIVFKRRVSCQKWVNHWRIGNGLCFSAMLGTFSEAPLVGQVECSIGLVYYCIQSKRIWHHSRCIWLIVMYYHIFHCSWFSLTKYRRLLLWSPRNIWNLNNWTLAMLKQIYTCPFFICTYYVVTFTYIYIYNIHVHIFTYIIFVYLFKYICFHL